ncbi:MAG: 16S rRNA (guanine(966)-N(2))-methyltransferase RsmD [Verrucomicrobia bacterium]|nr:16S rRNA (guanine(966)-N(2))-methyltransferase RsmD [Verrucomicrobiota bacterium]
MRITGGIYAGRILQVPKGCDVRPATDTVKQAIFNSLGTMIAGASVLELFAGTGALGLECLSRGAAHVVAVEKSSRHASVIRSNYEALGLARECLSLRCQDVFTAIRQLRDEKRVFSLILADPPFGEKNIGYRSRSLAQALLDNEDLPWLLVEADGLFVLRHTFRETLSFSAAWEETRLLRHGDSVIRFFKRTTFLSVEQSAGNKRL